MLNQKDASGMYSKTGRVLYEKMHILRKKDEILNPESRRKNLPGMASEMDELVVNLDTGTALRPEDQDVANARRGSEDRRPCGTVRRYSTVQTTASQASPTAV